MSLCPIAVLCMDNAIVFRMRQVCKASEMVSKLPRDLGAGDTMTREEIWMSIGHMLGMNEDVKEMRDAMKTRAGIKVGRRARAPKYESKVRETKEIP